MLVAAITLVLMASLVPTMAHHDDRVDRRTVQPYNVPVSFHIPVVAGYEPFPPPLHCLPGDPAPTDVLYHEDFSGEPGWTFIGTPLSYEAINLWHVSDRAGPGADPPGVYGQRLYFGLPAESTLGIPGTYHLDDDRGRHVAGTAQSPPIQLPEEIALVLTFHTKWAVEWLKGYDHLWVELMDEDGQVHILCTANAFDRGDGTSGGNEHRIGSCSPVLFGPCPTGDPFSPSGEPNDYPVDGLPGWETRTVAIPDRFAGQEVHLRFTFDSADGVANQFMGWMVDDVQITHDTALPI